MPYTDPSTLTFALNESPLQSSKLNQATNDQFLAVLPDGVTANAWSPTLKATTTDPTTSSVSGREYTIGPIQFLWARWVLSTPGSGIWYVAAPSTASGVVASTVDGAGQVVGKFLIRDDSPGWVRGGSVYLDTTSQLYFVFDDTNTENGLLTHNNIRPWASGDVLSLVAQYPIA